MTKPCHFKILNAGVYVWKPIYRSGDILANLNNFFNAFT